jgi:hypothetical protein
MASIASPVSDWHTSPSESAWLLFLKRPHFLFPFALFTLHSSVFAISLEANASICSVFALWSTVSSSTISLRISWALQDQQGNWIQGNLAQAQEQVRKLARVETTLEVQRGKQRHPKRQPVEVDIASCPVRLTYSTGVRRKEPGELVTKDLWLVQVQVLGTTQAPWWLLTDWPVEDAQSALRIFIMYRERWAAEDSFKVTKECLGWEEVQVLDWQALQTLVALAWVTAGFLYQMGVTFQWAEVQLLAKLGGWEPHKDRKPGKITLLRGLSRLVEMLATQAVLSRYASEHQGLPPNITAVLHGWQPLEEL